MQSFGKDFSHIGNDNKENAITVLHEEMVKVIGDVDQLPGAFTKALDKAKTATDPTEI